MFYRSIVAFVRDLPGTAKRFWVLVLLAGTAAGLGAVLLLRLLELVERIAWPAKSTFLGEVMAAGPPRRLIVTVAGGLLVMLVALLVRRPLGGHGTAGIIESIWLRGGKLSLWRALMRGVTSIIVVGLGAPLGREGALIQTGAAVSSWLGEKLRLPADQLRLLVACGAAAGIAAAYNVPIGAALFGLEVLLGSFALELFGPMVVSCVVATVISRTLLANHAIYLVPHYRLIAPRELLLSLLFAPFLGAASALYVRVLDGVAKAIDRLPRRFAWLWPPLGLGLVGVASIWLPQLLGNGYDTVDAALLGQLTARMLLILPAAKMLATALAAGSGVPGGLFTPSLFYGALLGGAFGHLASRLLPGVAPPGAYALMGMGAVLAGTTHAAISAVLIIFELTGDYDVILPLMVTCAVSAAVSRRLEPDSLYTSALHRRKVVLPEVPSPEWLRARRVRELVRPGGERVLASAPFDQVLLKLLALPPGRDLYVVSNDERLLGIIVLDALKGHIPDRDLLHIVVAADVMDARVQPLTAAMTLSEAAERFGQVDLDKLPVVDGRGRLVGTISKTDLLRQRRF